VLATGYNVVDVDAAKELGITVCNVPEYSTNSVAEFVFALILEICHHVGSHNRAVKEGQWTKSRDFAFWNHPLFELSGKTLGIIGYGKIGQATAKLAAAFGMNVLAYSRSRKAGLISDGIRYADMDGLCAGSDIISLHCPLFPETAGMVGGEFISKCKDGVIIINTARGGLVAESDMKAALESGKVSYFAADVAANEPIDADSPLLTAPNTILTPHIAWATKEARARLMETTVKNLEAYLDGTPQNVVNK
jgi:glycerate dehydrogenase